MLDFDGGSQRKSILTEQVLSFSTEVLTERQRNYYLENGCVRIERLVSDGWVKRLPAASKQLVNQSRAITVSDDVYVLETGHSAEMPRLKRLTSPVSHHPDFWDFASNSNTVDAVADVVGLNARFYYSKLKLQVGGWGAEF